MRTITLAKNFSFLAASGQTLLGDWIGLGELSVYQNAVLHVHCQTLSPTGGPSGLDVSLRTSFDEVEHVVVAGSISMLNPGSSSQAINNDLADRVQLSLANGTAGLLMGIVSVWLQLKGE